MFVYYMHHYHLWVSWEPTGSVCINLDTYWFVKKMKIWKSTQRRRKDCALAVVRQSQKFRHAADPLPGSAERPKFNQLEMVTFTYKPSLARIDTQFRVIVVTDPHTPTPTHKQTQAITIHCTAVSEQCNKLHCGM